MGGMPTYKAHYVPHDLNPLKNYKPDNFVDAGKVPFEGATMYKTDYVLKQNEPCPVIPLTQQGYPWDAFIDLATESMSNRSGSWDLVNLHRMELSVIMNSK